MTGKKKRQTGPAGKKMATVALSLCLLAGVTMFGMYTVGKTEEQQKKLEQEMADAENAAKAREQELAAAREQKAAQVEEERQAASGSASRDRTDEEVPAETARSADRGHGLGQPGAGE